ncbi:LOW QUALITY PROTEIN: sialic acid-binding Ig-like lectin 13 [Micropterus salmoides]|uniref:LOW QUALITY PROTEIN: sialic acid-binding Ig-like lectin 13 n=1 Tax=Micropterus salmoides TaxID=27706 RepID=UPI0018EE1316|nr:LOW QUALITY PROTEIN: sialic acid-binding Ig-like lectin 13 [Micropterus salmoides]
MTAALTLLLIGWPLQRALCGQFEVTVPQTIEVLRGSCVTIPCSFDVENNYESNLDNTCKALWKITLETVVFDSSTPQQNKIKGMTGDLTKKDCTTTLNNMQPEHSKKYFFRVQCNNALKHNFPDQKLEISVKDGPPRPTLTPSTLKVKEGTSVKLTCSAPAPCLSHPPALTWTPSLGDIHETLQENQDKTKFKTSVLTFTASHLHHRQEISCTAVYNKQDGSTESSVTTRLTADILFAPQILPSTDCTNTTGHLNCSCESMGNPSPTLQWHLDGFPVNNSDKFAISSETLNDTGLKSFITWSRPQWRDFSPLLCQSSNSLGSARFYAYIFQPQTSAERYDLMTLAVFITIVVALLVVVCALLLVIRAQKTRHCLLKSKVAMNLGVTNGEGKEVPKATEEDIYVNTADILK